MKTIFLVILFSYIYALSELAEKKKKENYLKRIFDSDITKSMVYYDYNEKQKLILKSKYAINSKDSILFIPCNYIFTNRIFV